MRIFSQEAGTAHFVSVFFSQKNSSYSAYTQFECMCCLLPVVSCSTTDANVTCLYRNVTDTTSKLWQLPKWYIDNEPISPHSIAEYHDTTWRMVYDYSGLSPGKHVFHGKLKQAPGPLLQTCCGPLPEVFLTLTVEDGKVSRIAGFKFCLMYSQQ